MKDDLERDLDLLALAEGGASLSQERRQQLESEIAASEDLAARYEATRLVLKHVDQMPVSGPSYGFSQRLERRLDAIDEARARGWFSWLRTPARSWAAAAAAAAAVALAVVFVGNGTPRPKPVALAQVELLSVAENLELLQNLDVIEQLDILEDLDVIESLETEEPG